MASGPVSKAIYWRRRFVVLAGLLAVLALIAYACRPSADEEDSIIPASTDSSPGSEDAPHSAGSAEPSIPASPPDDPDNADDSPETDDAGEGDPDTTAVGGSTDPDFAAGGSSGGGSSGAQSTAAPCHPENVVVTVHSDRDDYAAGVYPVLTLTLVNTGSTTCRADVGPDTLELRITSGNDRIWSSADCGDAFRAEAVELRRGVPHDVDLTWDRTRSWPDCRDDVVHARPGTYVAKAYSDYEVAGSQVFRLH